MQAAHAEGRLTLSATMQLGGDGAVPGCCGSELRCSRPEARAVSSPCNIHGVCGAVCMHGFPLRGGFVDMPDPENYSYYVYLLLHLLSARDDVGDAYIDFGCRFRTTWARYVAQHPELPQQARDLRIMVNWLHAAGHDLSCQMLHSGRYTLGAGRRVGEEAEQLWSMTRVSGGGGYSSSIGGCGCKRVSETECPCLR